MIGAMIVQVTNCGGAPEAHGTVDDLIEFRRRTRVDLVIFSLPVSAEDRILQMLLDQWPLCKSVTDSTTNQLKYTNSNT